MIWFLLGAAVVSFSWMMTSVLSSTSQIDHSPILRISSLLGENSPANEDDFSNSNLAAGEKIRDCGAKAFQIELPSHGVIYSLPINAENASTITCLIKKLGGSDSELSLEIETNDAQTH